MSNDQRIGGGGGGGEQIDCDKKTTVNHFYSMGKVYQTQPVDQGVIYP